jgi:hypothetical protein
MTSKSKKYNNFREFYEDDDRPRKKPKVVKESQKQKDKFRSQLRFMDPKNIKDEDFDEYEEN